MLILLVAKEQLFQLRMHARLPIAPAAIITSSTHFLLADCVDPTCCVCRYNFIVQCNADCSSLQKGRSETETIAVFLVRSSKS